MIPLFGNTIDFSFLSSGVKADVQTFSFIHDGNSGIGRYQSWIKPRGVSMISMLLIGGGSGGGAGLTGATTTARGGGGGGACSGVAFHVFPAYVLPDLLFVFVGRGGPGGSASGFGGTSGVRSYVLSGHGLTTGFTVPNIIANSLGSTGPSGGGAGANSGNAAGGTAATTATKSQQGWSQCYSISTFTDGIAGATGGIATGAAGTAITADFNTLCLSPGAGGGGVNSSGTGFAGGSQSLQAAMDLPDATLTPNTDFIPAGAAGSGVLAGGAGGSGLSLIKPFLFTGGAGGGSADGQPGGIGGRGGIGCGGGGGGGGTTGGRGGDGGPGLVIITSW